MATGPPKMCNHSSPERERERELHGVDCTSPRIIMEKDVRG
jgi:hypothetical protein